MQSQVEIAAEIVEEQVNNGAVSTDLYMKGNEAGLNVDFLIENAEAIYAVSEEEFNETFDTD